MTSRRDLEDLSDDEALFQELEKEEDAELAVMRELRIKEIQEEVERRRLRDESKYGIYTEMDKEKEFMDMTTKEKYVVCHFFHKDFRRCKIMDTHLEKLSSKFHQTKFVRMEVMNAPFLIEKLEIQVLPCVIAWVEGYIKAKLVGFDDLGNTDNFETALLELKLTTAGVLRQKKTIAAPKKKSIFQGNGGEDSSGYDTDE